MTRRTAGRSRRTLQQTVEQALHPRLLGGAGVAAAADIPAPPIQDLFPQELEAALDRTVAEFHARPRAADKRLAMSVDSAGRMARAARKA